MSENNNRKMFDNLVSRTKIYLIIILILFILISIIKPQLIIPSIILYVAILCYTYFANNKRKSEISEQLQDLILTVDSAAKSSLINSPIPLVILETNGNIVWKSAKFVNEFAEVDINNYLMKHSNEEFVFDFKDVKGQSKAKKALEIAAAGGHNLLMTGSPGSGKTLMAKCLPSILPPLELQEALELTKIYSICGLLNPEEPLMIKRPYRAVHHTASPNGIIGGGTNPKPGEITLAHRGVLFLDEMAEFPRQVLEVLRQPLEDGEIVISRAKISIKYPAKFMLIGAMNPCPCGFLGDREKECTCTDYQIQKYRARLSGPLLDRIDLIVNVPRLTSEELINTKIEAEPSSKIRERVIMARKTQAERYKGESILTNSELNPKQIKKYCFLDKESTDFMRQAAQKYNLSGRKFNRVLKIARTIADLEAKNNIELKHLMSTLQYKVDMN